MAYAECQVVKAEDDVGAQRRQFWQGLEMAASQLSPHLPPPPTQADITDPSRHIFLSRRQNPSQRQLQPASTTQQGLKRELMLTCIGVLLDWLPGGGGGKPCFVTFASKFHDLNVSTMVDSVVPEP